MTRLGYHPDEVAGMLGLSRASVYRAIKRGDIPAERVAGRLIVPAAALRAKFGEPIEDAAA